MACNGLREVSGLAYDSSDGTIFISDIPQTFPVNQIFEVGPVEPPSATLESLAEISSTAVKLIGKVNPRSGTSYANPASDLLPGRIQAQLGLDLDPLPRQRRRVGAGTSDIPVGAFLSGLTPNSSYDVRLAARKQYRRGASPTRRRRPSARCPRRRRSAPSTSTDVTETTANLHATIDPYGEATKYRFEYGTTPSYGSSAPIPDGELPAAQGRQPVVAHITGLNGGTYHFRVVAENGSGTTTTGRPDLQLLPARMPERPPAAADRRLLPTRLPRL